MPRDDDSELARQTWDAVPTELFVVPLGSCEQHGPHLPLGTDAVIAAVVARDLVSCATAAGVRAALAPTVPYGASGEHEGFAGTVSIGTEALTAVLVELGRSAGRWASRQVFVNGHGGNVEALGRAVPLLRAEGRDVAWVPCAASISDPPPDLHAGRIETSLLLAHAPGQVRIDRAAPGDTRPVREILPDLRAHGVRAVSANGVLGDPAGANAAEGKRLWRAFVQEAWQRIQSGRVNDAGMAIAHE